SRSRTATTRWWRRCATSRSTSAPPRSTRRWCCASTSPSAPRSRRPAAPRVDVNPGGAASFRAMEIASLSGGAVDVPAGALTALRSRLRGPLILPGEPGYEDSRTVWNAMIDRRPALVVRCSGTADVLATVRFAREHDLLLAIKGGGHNIAGLAVADGALLLD